MAKLIRVWDGSAWQTVGTASAVGATGPTGPIGATGPSGAIGATGPSPLTTKGDLYTYNTNNTRLAVGTNGETLISDSTDPTGLRWQGQYYAGKNKIINGDFDIWQRGTSFSNPGSGVYTADRFKTVHNGTGATRTISQQTFTLGTAPVAGYEGQYFLRYNVSVAGSSNTFQGIVQAIEDVRTFANQTATISFWAKADSERTLAINLVQVFGSGGSSSVFATLTPNEVSLTTAWQRFTINASVPSIAGKTIGSGNALDLRILPPANTVCTVDIWGVQVEAGSTATAFTTASGNPNLEITASGTVVQDGILFSSNASSNASASGTNSWAGYQVAGKNKIINGDFGIWQRGTSFTMTNSTTYFADRWRTYRDGSGSTLTVTRETFTPGTAPIAGYEGRYFARFNQSVAGTGGTYSGFSTPLEDVRTFAGQTVTVSFWAKADSNKSVAISLEQVFGSGGSSPVYPSPVSGATASITTSWQRFQTVFNVNSISGKTIGTNSLLNVYLNMPLNQTSIIDIWGWQIEAGSVATPFTTATGTVQGELAACQRYYVRYSSDATNPLQSYGFGVARAATYALQTLSLPVEMRIAPTAIEYGGNLELWDGVNAATATTTLTLDAVSSKYVRYTSNTASGLTQYRPYTLRAANTASAYVGFTSEL